MQLVVFGLAVTSAWGNGHATLWRSLSKALGARGHHLVFFERDSPWYASERDVVEIPGLEAVVYPTWEEVLPRARAALAAADAGIVTSYCADGAAASELVLASRVPVRAFYDLDTPVTLWRVESDDWPDYLPQDGLAGFDLVLSFTGGDALRRLRAELGARRTVPLYGSVDPEAHHPVPPWPGERGDLSYLGTFAADRQAALERLFLAAARARPERRFLIGGAQYPQDFPWTENIFFHRHVPPQDHAAFFAASRLTLNLTRRAMAAFGWCPSGRIFEAAACGTPIVSDWWEGLDHFYRPGEEILIAHDRDDVLAALDLGEAALQRIARRARERTLEEHSSERRAAELVDALETALAPAPEA